MPLYLPSTGGGGGAVDSVNGRTGTVTGLAEASDLTALDGRVDKLDNPTVTLTDASTIAVDATLGHSFEVVVTASGHVLGKPSGGADGQVVVIAVAQDGTGSRAWTLHADYRLPAGEVVVPSTTADAVDKLAVQYDAGADKWDVLAFRRDDGAVSAAGRRWRSGSQSQTGFDQIALNTDSFLTGGMAASGNGIAVPLDGLYLCVGAIYVQYTAGGGVRNGIFAVNNVSVQQFGLTLAAGEVRLSGAAILELTANDVVSLYLYQNTDPGNIGGGDESDTNLVVRYLGVAS